MTRRQTIDPQNLDFEIIQEVASLICEGYVVVLPTDTAYGLVGDPTDTHVIQRVLSIKERSEKHGMPLLAASISQVQKLVRLTSLAKDFVTYFWPGAVTVIAPTRQTFPSGITGPTNSLAIRIPDHSVTIEVIRATGFPIIGTSANKSNTPSPRSADMVVKQLGDQVDFILDAGATYHSADSTIVTFMTDPPSILREGAIPQSAIKSWLNNALSE
ncbi:MAG: L-threonylcarbamoyladenylate synthase [Promethearchaeota archaeon]